MAKRGRKPKPKMTFEEQENAVIEKFMLHEPMTYDEVALAIWMMEGRKTERPMTRQSIMKIEAKAMKKLKTSCEKAGITADDAFEIISRSRRGYAVVNNFGSTDTPE